MKNDWEKKEKTCSACLSSKIFATSAWVWMCSTSLSLFQRSNWSPTYILHLFHFETTSLLFIFLSESVKVRFLPHIDTFSFAQEPHVVYYFLTVCMLKTIIPITIVLGLFVKKLYLLQHNSALIFILWRSVRKTTIILGMNKLRVW